MLVVGGREEALIRGVRHARRGAGSATESRGRQAAGRVLALDVGDIGGAVAIARRRGSGLQQQPGDRIRIWRRPPAWQV
jgi:hypothetical protein